jgi:Domain of unknown function (DUF4149)
MYIHPMAILRFFLLLAMAVWVGALVFFPVVAQTSFAVLPSTHLAGLIVRSSLIRLHWIGLACGIVFLIGSSIYNRAAIGRVRAFRKTHLLVLLMLALTAVSQFLIIPKMDILRISPGEINLLTPTNPLRVQFDSLHAWSVRVEEAVLLLGLVVLYSLAQRFSSLRA